MKGLGRPRLAGTTALPSVAVLQSHTKVPSGVAAAEAGPQAGGRPLSSASHPSISAPWRPKELGSRRTLAAQLYRLQSNTRGYPVPCRMLGTSTRLRCGSQVAPWSREEWPQHRLPDRVSRPRVHSHRSADGPAMPLHIFLTQNHPSWPHPKRHKCSGPRTAALGLVFLSPQGPKVGGRRWKPDFLGGLASVSQVPPMC